MVGEENMLNRNGVILFSLEVPQLFYVEIRSSKFIYAITNVSVFFDSDY